MRENTDQNNSEYKHFLRSVKAVKIYEAEIFGVNNATIAVIVNARKARHIESIAKIKVLSGP